MAEHASATAKMVDGFSASCPPGTLMKAFATPYPVGPIGDPVSLHHERRHAEMEYEDVFAMARARQKLQLRAEQLERSEDQIAHPSNARRGLDIEGLGTQLRAFAACGSLGTRARATQVRPGFSAPAAQTTVGERPDQCQSLRYVNIDTTSRDGLVSLTQAALAEHLRTLPVASSRGGAVGSDSKAYKGLDTAAQNALLAEQIRLNPRLLAALAPALASARGGVVASEAKGQKGRGLRSSIPQTSMSSDSHAAVSSSSGATLSAPPGTWITPSLPPKKHGMQEPPRSREVQRSPKSAGSTCGAPMPERGGRAGGKAALDRRVEYADTAQRHSKGFAAANLNAAALKRKNREKQSHESARKDALSLKLKRFKFLQIQEGTLRFDLREEDMQDELHSESPEGESPCDEDVALTNRSPWDFGFYDR